MARGGAQAGMLAQLLSWYLPEAVAGPVGTGSISNNEQFFTGGIECFAYALPPPSDTFHGKCGGLMVNAHIDESPVGDEVINAVRGGFCRCEAAGIRHVDGRCSPFGLPYRPYILEKRSYSF